MMKEAIISDNNIDAYPVLEELVATFLSDGYKMDEIGAEFRLTAKELNSLEARCDPEWMDRHRSSWIRHVARNRARVLKSPAYAMTIVERLDQRFSPKLQPLIGMNFDAALTDEEREKLRKLFPSEEKMIEAEFHEANQKTD